MSCKLGSTAQSGTVRPVAWRPVDSIAAESGRPAPSISQSELEHAVEQHRLAEERIRQLERSIDTLQRESWEQGFHAGRAEAQQAAQVEIEEAARCATESISQLVNLRARWLREIEGGAVSLALAVARRVLNRELSLDADAIQAVVRVALEKADRREVRHVRVPPVHVQSVRTCLAQEAPGVEVIADPALNTGEVRFEMSEGAMDASIGAQLEEIERGFADAAPR